MSVTAADIQALPSGEFSSLADVVIEKYITRATKLVSENAWGDLYDDAVELLTAHLLVGSMSGGVGNAGPVVSEAAGPFSRSYATPTAWGYESLDSTSYGKQFKELRATLNLGGFVV